MLLNIQTAPRTEMQNAARADRAARISNQSLCAFRLNAPTTRQTITAATTIATLTITTTIPLRNDRAISIPQNTPMSGFSQLDR